MGTSLVGLLPQNTYVGLIKVGNNTALNATLKTLSDGAGNDLPMQASTTAINFTGTTTGLTSGVAGAIQFSDGSAFASDAANFFWNNTTKRLGIGTNAPAYGVDVQSSVSSSIRVKSTLSGSYIDYTNSFGSTHSFGTNGNAFVTVLGGAITTYLSSDGTNTFGNSATSLGARVGIKGSGSTSATTSLLVQNSAGTELLKVTDDGNAKLGFAGTNDAKLFFEYPRISGGIIFGDAISGGTVYGRISLDRGNGEMRVGAVAVGGYFLTLYSNGSEAARFDTVQSLGIGTTTINSSAKVQISSTTKGFLPPVMTTTQKNAIATPAAGLVVYDSTAKSPGYYDGTNWGYTGGALQNATGNGGTLNVSFAAGNIVNLTLNATTTLAFANSVIGTYIIQVTQSAGGGSSLVYPASVKWSGGTAPTLSTAVGKTDILTFYYDGTNYYGNYSLNY